jgi:hypothetical protein
MATNDELDQRLAAVEDRLGIDEPPPLDGVSRLEFKLDSLRELLNYQGITQGEHGRALRLLQADVSTLKVDMAETKAGVAAILELLTRDQD